MKTVFAAACAVLSLVTPVFCAPTTYEVGALRVEQRGLLQGVEQLEVVSISPARNFVMFDQPEKFSAALDAALAGMQIRP